MRKGFLYISSDMCETAIKLKEKAIENGTTLEIVEYHDIPSGVIKLIKMKNEYIDLFWKPIEKPVFNIEPSGEPPIELILKEFIHNPIK